MLFFHLSILENNTLVHTFNANEKVTWSLNGGADSSKFIIDSNSGELNFIPVSTPDYENPSDSDENNSYIVTVRATDTSSYITDQTVTIIVDDVSKFQNYISCDSNTKSEIVIPIYDKEELIAVLDIDSPNLRDFNKIDKEYLERISILI